MGKDKFTKAYVTTKDVSIPRALYVIGEDVEGNTLYEHQGINYPEGSYVLEEDISPVLREKAADGELDFLEDADRDEAVAALTNVNRGLFSPEHGVEHEALVNAGKRVIDRETQVELRSLGAEDAAAAQAEALESEDSVRALAFEEGTQPNLNEGETGSVRVYDAPDDTYATAEEAEEAGLQITPSGVSATNPFVRKAEAGAEKSEKKPKAAKKLVKPKAHQDKQPSTPEG